MWMLVTFWVYASMLQTLRGLEVVECGREVSFQNGLDDNAFVTVKTLRRIVEAIIGLSNELKRGLLLMCVHRSNMDTMSVYVPKRNKDGTLTVASGRHEHCG